MSKTITVHTIVKNEENFAEYAVRSVIDFVDKIIIFDTGSTDKTIKILTSLKQEFPEKIIFEEKGECDKKRHTELRQEMLERTETDWFMIVDGDEVWTKRGMEEALREINIDNGIECLIVPFYLCVGDIFHRHYKEGNFEILGKKDFFTIRFLKNNNVRWRGEYGEDEFVDKDNNVFVKKENSRFLKNKFWHLTHLERSKLNNIYSSGGRRDTKEVLTYFIVGRGITEEVPEVFKQNLKKLKLSLFKSFINFLPWIIKKLTKNFGK